MVNLNAITILLLTSCLHCCQQRIFRQNTRFYAVRISILLAIFFLKFSFNLATFWLLLLRVMQENKSQKWVFFSEHSVSLKLKLKRKMNSPIVMWL